MASEERKARVNGFGPGKPISPGRYVLRNDKWVPVDEVGMRPKKHDSVNIRSAMTGCAADQVDEFNQSFGHLGVKYEKGSGDAIYETRQAKLKVLKARGQVDLHEVRS